MKIKRNTGMMVGAVAAAVLVACGGGTGTSSTDSVSDFPSGVAVASPTALTNSAAIVASAAPSGATMLASWSRAMWVAVRQGDMKKTAHLLARAVPIAKAYALPPSKVPEALVMASEIDALLEGRITLSYAGLIDVDDLFSNGAVNASCFGPSVAYAGHDDGSPTSGTLPSGDLGLWTDDQAGGEPCSSAELTSRLDSVQKQVRQAIILMAAMRVTISDSGSLTMPAAGATTTLTSDLATALTSLAAGTTVDSATVSLNGGGTQYTYRLTLSRGSGVSAQSSEVVVLHTPGSSSTAYTGVVQITAESLSTDAAFGCSDEIDGGTGRYKVATATTISYDRNGTAGQFGGRSGNYCGAHTVSSTDYIGDIAVLTSGGELDPAEDLNGSSVRAGNKQWRGNFSRFAGDLDAVTQAGDFLYVWQAGNGDSNGRAFALHATYDSGTEARALNAYYSYTGDIQTTNGDLLGMICNWAGPSGSHTPGSNFQSQALALGSSATAWSRTDSKISYAPTNNCNSSSGMTYDADGVGGIVASEGASVTNNLDVPTGGRTVQQEIVFRGYTKPTLF